MESGFIVAIAVGIGVAIQVAVIGKTADHTNPLAISLALQIAGVSVAAVWATNQGRWSEVLDLARSWWLVPLGVGGWLVVASLGYASNRIGVGATISITIAAQMCTAILVDFTRSEAQPSIRTLSGGALVIAGAILVGSAS